MRYLRVEARDPAPFLKWVGGKGRLREVLLGLLPKGADGMVHVEPFLGGGALFFARRPQRALLCDLNEDLIGVYDAVQGAVTALIRELSKLVQERGTVDGGYHYSLVRERFNDRVGGCVERAAQFIYLNRTCFNGVFRVNKAGRFNVPPGSYANPTILDPSCLYAAHRALARAELRTGPFGMTLRGLGKGHFVYLDPPYDPVSETANFTSFTEEGFGRGNQVALRGVFGALDRRGAKVMLSNSDTPFVRELYQGFDVTEVRAPRSVNSKTTARGAVPELVVRNYR